MIRPGNERWSAMAALAGIAAAVITGAACSGGGSKSSTAKFSESSCYACIGEQCTAELEDCADLDDCGAALECLGDCPVQDNALDTDCAEESCSPLVTTSAGETAFSAMVGCYLAESGVGGGCESACAPSTD